MNPDGHKLAIDVRKALEYLESQKYLWKVTHEEILFVKISMEICHFQKRKEEMIDIVLSKASLTSLILILE